MNKINIYLLIRVFVGCLLLVSGFGKVVEPYQNFLYVIQAYQFLPPAGETLIAQTIPWIEFLLGVFLVLGLWLTWTLRGVIVLFGGFVLVVTQALVRGIPLADCGCFGEWLHIPPLVMLVFDSVVFLLLCLAARFEGKTRVCSLDRYFETS